MEIRKLFVHHAQFVLSYEIRIAVEGLRFKFSQKRQYVKTHAKMPFRLNSIYPFGKQSKVPTAMENSHMLEYVIEINFIPKIPLTRPD